MVSTRSQVTTSETSADARRRTSSNKNASKSAKLRKRKPLGPYKCRMQITLARHSCRKARGNKGAEWLPGRHLCIKNVNKTRCRQSPEYRLARRTELAVAARDRRKRDKHNKLITDIFGSDED